MGGSYNRAMVRRSRRIPGDLSPNRLAAARARIGRIPYDLTLNNPTACGLPYPKDLLRAVADPRGLRYEPDPRGPLEARRAVADLYRTWGTAVDSRRIVLTASTSEAYSFLFRLFCDPGESILIPAPSYPLLQHLASLDGIDAVTYNLEAEAGWSIDFAALQNSPASVRAVVVVHPNNPTGSFVHPGDRERLLALCSDRDWTLIADEVFLSFPLEGGPGEGTTFAAVESCLACTLGGLSKRLGLPQLKLAWIVVSGPDGQVEPMLEGIDYVADAYLSVSTPLALALPSLIAAGAPQHDAIADRCRSNLETLRDAVARHPAVTLPAVGGGWSAVLRVPSVIDEEELCLRLLERRGVAVHPGHYFNFSDNGRLVLSLLPPLDTFADGTRTMLEEIEQTIA